jgi:hypothetical protein
VELNDALLALEHQAAVVASFLDPDDDELLQQIADAWAPVPNATKGSNRAQRARWRREWLSWVLECGDRWEARPTELSVDEMHRVLIRWACARRRRR